MTDGEFCTQKLHHTPQHAPQDDLSELALMCNQGMLVAGSSCTPRPDFAQKSCSAVSPSQHNTTTTVSFIETFQPFYS